MLGGFGFGGGLADKPSLNSFDPGLDIGNSFFFYDFGSITELDARVYYGQDNWEVDLSASNITNTKYYAPAFNRLQYGIKVNLPRQFRLGFTYNFS